MQQYAQAAKGLIANLQRDLKELNLRLPEALAQQLQPASADPLGAAGAGAGPALAAASAAASAEATGLAPAPAPSGAAARRAIEDRVFAFKDVLLSSRVDLPRLRELAAGGIPDRDGLRAVTWKLLLGYLPPDPAGWDELLARKRAQYRAFCDELIVDPKRAEAEAERGLGANPLGVRAGGGGGGDGGGVGGGGGGGTIGGTVGASGDSSGDGNGEASGSSGGGGGGGGDPLASGTSAASTARRLQGRDAADHPLALGPSSAWSVFFEDGEVMAQIDRDVMRTHPDMHFFSGDGAEAAAHRAEMRRALFLFAKLNPGLRYVQGMNELLAPLYHAFRTAEDANGGSGSGNGGSNSSGSGNGSAAAVPHAAEADAFYCLAELMGELRDLFCAQLDNSASGARATAARLAALVRAVDPQLAAHVFDANRVDPQFFAFRWVTLLLTQELPFPDAVRVWDTLLADPRGRVDAVLRVCLAMLLRAKGALMAGDFAANVKLLQRYPPVDVGAVLADAAALPACDDLVPPPL